MFVGFSFKGHMRLKAVCYKTSILANCQKHLIHSKIVTFIFFYILCYKLCACMSALGELFIQYIEIAQMFSQYMPQRICNHHHHCLLQLSSSTEINLHNIVVVFIGNHCTYIPLLESVISYNMITMVAESIITHYYNILFLFNYL